MFKNARLASNTITNVNELDGIGNITEDERILIGNRIENVNITRSDSVLQSSAVSRKKTAKFQRVTSARKTRVWNPCFVHAEGLLIPRSGTPTSRCRENSDFMSTPKISQSLAKLDIIPLLGSSL